ncbi:MAG: S8 family serine peptidase [Saprospiraceae bacterium]
MKKLLFTVAIVILCLSTIFAQKLTHVQGELLVKPVAGVDVKKWAKNWQTFDNDATQFQVVEKISEPLDVWRCTFDFTKINEYKLLDAIRLDRNIEVAQFNHLIEQRSTVPNDLQFDLQWWHFNVGQSTATIGEDLDSDLAWDITTGGVTASGDTVVVCIIDDGLSTSHPDLAGNVWVNRAEIPGNGRDDDGNGYVDDFRGWNIVLNNDVITNRTIHGTPIAGIIGAKGNNGVGIAGINWNVKLMMVAGVPQTEAQALTAYSYPLTMRRRYNASNGRQGAFVVATNSSWGTPGSFPTDAPLWCAVYDSLGTQGIMNVSAVPNANTDVEQSGDLPTLCTSDYLMTVTNIDQKGLLYQDAAYGTTSVDLGAYGERIWTTTSPDGYGNVTGTSYAAPQVTGAIALLYSAPCRNFAALYKSDPKAAALFVRQYILQGTKPGNGLSLFTVSGGKLNLYKPLQLLSEACAECFPPTSIAATNLTDKNATLNWLRNAEITRVDLRWRAVGAANWTEIANATSPVTLNNLSACTNYEFQLNAYCSGEAQGYTKSTTFRTDGCCTAPVNPQVSYIGGTIANISWQRVLAASSYSLQLRVKGTQNWQTYTTTGTSLLINMLTNCTQYDLRLASLCNGTLSEYSTIYNFQTPNCGACRDLPYCVPRNLNSSDEWIASVKLHTLTNTSGSNEGYGDYTGLTAPKLSLGGKYNLELRPGFSGVPYSEYFIVWIDFNQDGVFVSQEMVYEKGSIETVFSGMVTIPANAKLGMTRMRVAMQFFSPGGPCSFNSNSGAEVEDYCVEIVQTTNVQEVMNTTSLRVFPNPFAEQLVIEVNLTETRSNATIELLNALGQSLRRQSLPTLLPGVQNITMEAREIPAGLYFIRYQDDTGASITKKVVKQER